MLSFGLIAYMVIGTKYKYISYILWGISNIYWSVIAYGKGEKILCAVMIIYTVFCIYHLLKIKKRWKEKL